MKILHVVSSYIPAYEFGGPIQSVHLLNKYLVKYGAGVSVYTTNSGLRNNPLMSDIHGMSDIKIIDGVKVFYFPYYGYVHFTFSPSLFFALKKSIRNFALVHITGVWNFPIMAAAFWARFYKIPYIISPRGSLMAEPLERKSSLIKKTYLNLIAKRDLKNAAAIHFTAESEKNEYLKAGLPLKKYFIIPNGLDLEQFKEIQSIAVGQRYVGFREKFGIAKGKKIVLFLGRLNWKKGLDTLIPAFAKLIKKEPQAVLVLAGPDGGYQGKILELIAEVNLRTSDVRNHLRTSDVQNIKNANVFFTGMIVGDNKISALRESDVFVLPSYSENFGLAVAEAMYFNLPVVITKYVGISPYVLKSGAGLVVEKDEKQVSEAILKILNNPEQAKQMGERGRELVETEFSPDNVAQKMLAEYHKIK